VTEDVPEARGARLFVTRRPLALGGSALVGLLTVAHGAADVPYAALSALLPTIQARFDLSIGMLAILVATFTFAASLTQPVFGELADRVGARMVGPIGVVASSAMLALVGVAPTLWLGIGLLLAGGMASAAMHPAFTGLARREGGSRPGVAVSIFSAGGTLGVSIGPIAVFAIMTTFGVSGTPLLMVPGVLIGTVAWFVIPDEEPGAARRGRPLFDMQLVRGPVGGLTLAALLAFLPLIAFNAGIGIWLVQAGVARDAPIIGLALTTFAVGGAAGGIAAGALATRLNARAVIGGSLLAAALPLYALFALQPGSAAWLLAAGLAGALLNAPIPLMVVTAQALVPRSMAAASGMLMGLAHGVAGLLYVGVGALQEAIGIGPALAATFALVVPAAAVAAVVLGRVARSPTRPTAACSCRACQCSVPGMCACVA
jgi:MFS transporter, FSR family, fosmidomycin resistance protein